MSDYVEQIQMLANKVDKLLGNKMSDICESKAPLEYDELKALQEQLGDILQKEDIRAEIDELQVQLEEERDSWQDMDMPMSIEWESEITEYFVRQIDIWLRCFAKRDKLEEIKVFIADSSSCIGMELLIDGIWDQLCFSDYEWQTRYLEHADWKTWEDVKGSAFLNELWAEFCDVADDEEKSQVINYIVSELQERYGCKVTVVHKRIQLRE